ncbi:helix-turn-helix domain-containing protein [Microbispora sp. GKU 823]
MAAHMGCTPQWVRQLAAAGHIPGARKVGRDWRFTVEENHDDHNRGRHPS